MIEISNLSFGYRKKKLLFENLNLKLTGGRVYGLLGKNGAGKSTLLKVIAGLVFPLSGECKVDGAAASRRLPETLRHLYLLPEEIHVPSLLITQFVRDTSPFYPGFNLEQFKKYLEEFQVSFNSKLKDLSFGQQKKVMIAFAVATNTRLLIMDEPTNGLDIPSKIQFRKIVASAFDEERCIIISTHQVRDLDNLIDTLVVVHQNKILLNKTLDEIGEKLNFGPVSASSSEVLYSESSFHGLSGISLNKGGGENKVDIEILFNAITVERQEILAFLNEEKNEQHI